jgi:predicted nucleic acid-binding protein
VKVFLDTNVLVSAFASRGLCADLFELVLLEHDLVLGRNVLRELSKALRGKVKLSTARTSEIVDFVAGEAVQVVEKVDPAKADVDADDALVVGEALAGQALSCLLPTS